MFKMTPNILRNFFTEKATRLYPDDARKTFANVRGELVNRIEKCTFCGICAVKCPSQCIVVAKKSATWTWDPFACVYCGICVADCPKKALYQKEMYRKPGDAHEMICLVGEIKKEKVSKDPSGDEPDIAF